MNNKFSIKIGDLTKSVFIQSGFYNTDCHTSPLHKHYYTEIHLLSRGELDCRIGHKLHKLRAGSMIAIPPGTFHEILNCSCNARHSAFQIDLPVKSVIHKAFSPALTEEFMDAAEKAHQTNNFNEISFYLSLFCSRFFDLEKIKVEPIRDYEFIIGEFFSLNYRRDVKLADLAAELCVSEKQAERLMIKYTGHTFKKELTAIRGVIAEHLIETKHMPLSEVAQYIGYKSYNGFWKAHIRNKKRK